MQKLQTAAMATVVALTMLLAPGNAGAQSAGSSSGITKTKGLMFGLHLNGTTIATEDEDNGVASAKKQRASGGGLGAQVGWGFTRWLMVYAGADAAKVEIEGVTGFDDDNEQPDYTLIHGDVGVRFSFPSAKHGFVPYLNAALTARVAGADLDDEDEKVSISSNGISVGGGLQYFFTPKWALDVGLQLSTGKFTEIEAGGIKLDLDELGIDVKNTNSARVNIGMKFYPHFGGR